MGKSSQAAAPNRRVAGPIVSRGVRIGQLLVRDGLVTPEQLEQALDAQRIYGGRLGTNLIELGHLSDIQLAQYLADQLHLPSVGPVQLADVPREAIEMITAETADRYQVVPFGVDRFRLNLAFLDPTNLAALDELSFRLRKQVNPYVAPEILIQLALERYYSIPRPTRYIRIVEDTRRPKMPSLPPIPLELPDMGDPTEPPGPRLSQAPLQLAELPSRLTLREAIEGLIAVDTDQAIVGVLHRFTAGLFKKTCVLELKDNRYEVVAATGPDAFARSIKGRRLSAVNVRTILLAVACVSNDGPLLAELGERPPATCAAVPLDLASGPQLVLLGVAPEATFNSDDVRRLKLLVAKAAVAAELVATKERLRRLPDDLR